LVCGIPQSPTVQEFVALTGTRTPALWMLCQHIIHSLIPNTQRTAGCSCNDVPGKYAVNTNVDNLLWMCKWRNAINV